jgi:hypothetical protein
MEFNEIRDFYSKFYKFEGGSTQVEPHFKDSADFQKKIASSFDKLSKGKFYGGYRNPLNTIAIADALSTRATASIDFFPELAMMFLKVYSKQLLDGSKLAIKPEDLVRVFNKNQELIEIPYPIALILGGMYYFQDNTALLTQGTGTEIVTITDYSNAYSDYGNLLKRFPAEVDSTKINAVPHFPSNKIFNRSVLTELNYRANNYTHVKDYKNASLLSATYRNELNASVTKQFHPTETIPTVGFGIQNNFISRYNRVLFGDYINSLNAAPSSNNHCTFVGGYTGILKPFKTYSSDVEFTAFYRTLNVSGYNFSADALKTELIAATNDLNYKSFANPATPNPAERKKTYNALVRCFLVYSKLKASFLSGQYPDKNSLKIAIEKICDTSNIVSRYKEQSSGPVSDFYYLVSNFFFSSFKEVLVNSNKDRLVHDQNNPTKNCFDVDSRLYLEIWYSKLAQEKFLTDDHDILNKDVDTIPKQVTSLTNFLYKIWSLEKFNLRQIYAKIDPKASFAIYPSAGGFLNPNKLLRPLSLDPNKISVDFYGVRTTTNFGFNNPNNGVGKKLVRPGYFYGLTKNPFTNNTYDFKSTLLLGKNPNRAEYLAELANPCIPKYAITTFDNEDFLNGYCFSNYSILRNSIRFHWFEDNLLGTFLQLDPDSNYSNPNQDYFIEDNDGIESGININSNPSNYLKNNNWSLYDYSTSKVIRDEEYDDIYNFNRLLDSINVEKLSDFAEEFKKFAKVDSFDSNENTFNLKSLMLSSTVLRSNELLPATEFPTGFKDDYTTGLSLNSDDVTLLLIGYHMYNYEFGAKVGLSKFFNVALTSAQKTRCEEVVDQFCSYNVTVANKSAIESVNKFGDFQLSMHRFFSSPEVLFSNKQTYNDLATSIRGNNTQEAFDRYISRKILTGTQFVPNVSFIAQDYTDIKLLNSKYLYNSLHHRGIDRQVFDPELFYLNLVVEIFNYLNIKYSRGNYLQLLMLIRSCSFFVCDKMGILNKDLLPNAGIINDQVVVNKSKNKIPFNYTQSNFQPVVIGFIKEFFALFNKNIYEFSFGSLNEYLKNINLIFTALATTDPSVTSRDRNAIERDSLKKRTYYNIKTIHEKTYVSSESDPLDQNTTVDLIGLNSIDVNSLVDDNLFYNYKVKDENCDDLDIYNSETYDLYQIFQVVDRGNNDIGTKTLANLVYFYNNLFVDFDAVPNKGQEDQSFSIKNLTNTSVNHLFAGLAEESGFLFQQIPNYLNINGTISKMQSDDDTIYDIVEDMFGVHTNTELYGSRFNITKRGVRFGGLFGFPGYIYQLGTISSEVNSGAEDLRNNNLSSFCLDIGYNSNNEIVVLDEKAPDEILKSNVSCFVVDFGIQSQQMFNNVQLDTNEFYDTEESIRAWVDVTNDSQQTIQTTNIFPILEKRSYSCTVTSLGNATIQPLTYFYLRNVPLFYGTYWITNVSHNISPNTMLTTFKGVRQPIATKNDIRKELISLIKKTASKIADANQNETITVVESLPDTSGRIVQIPNSALPYSAVLQKTDDGVSFFRYDGFSIVGAYIHSITNSTSNNNSNLGLVNVIYNQSRAFLDNTNDHAKIIANMKNIVIGLMRKRVSSGDKRYGDGEVSLSRLIDSNSNFTLTSDLGNLLTSIVDLTAFNAVRNSLADSNTIYSAKAFDANSNNLTNSNKLTRFVSDTIIVNTKASTVGIQDANIFIEEKDLYTKANNRLDGVGVNSLTSFAYTTVFDLFSKLSAGTNFLILLNKIESINNVNAKYLGAYDTGKVMFFSSASNNKFGETIWDDDIKIPYKLDDATAADLSGEFVPGTYTQSATGSSQAVNDFIARFVANSIAEYERWDRGKLKECTPRGTAIVKEYNDYTKLKNDWPCSLAWSALFISTLVKKSSEPNSNKFFPYSAEHNGYICDIRDGKYKDWKAYVVTDPVNGIPQLGDIICHGADKRYRRQRRALSDFRKWDKTLGTQECHCDVIVEVTDKNIFYIGGNLDDSSNRYSDRRGQDGLVIDRDVILRYIGPPTTSTTTAAPGATVGLPISPRTPFTAEQKYPILFAAIVEHESHTYDCHNWYDDKGNITSHFADRPVTSNSNENYPKLTKKISEYTIGEIRDFQKNVAGSSRLHATGRYQIIPNTLSLKNIKDANLTINDIYSPENQDKLSLTILRAPSLNYINGKVDSNKSNLEAAALDIAQRWEAVGVPYDMQGSEIWVKKNQPYYAKNTTKIAKTTTEVIQQALKDQRASLGHPI